MKTTISKFGPYDKYDLKNSDGTGFSFIPEFGGNLLQVWLKKGNEVVPVLDGHDSSNSLKNRTGSKSDLLIPFPNRIFNGDYHYGDSHYQFPVNHLKTQSAIHGFCNRRAFSVSEITGDEKEWSILLSAKYQGELEYYPFPFSTKLSYTFKEGNAFQMDIEVKNTGDHTMPLGLGWHPYLQLKTPIEECLCQFPSSLHLKANEQRIPTGEKENYTHFDKPQKIGSVCLDDGFEITQPNERMEFKLMDPNFDLTLLAWQGNPFNYAQVYIPPARKSIAIEPMTCAANAFNNKMGLKELSPNETFKGSFGLELK